MSSLNEYELNSKRDLKLSQKSLRFNNGGISEATLIWRKLDKFVDIEATKTRKQILYQVSGIAKPGEMVALMGKIIFSLTHSFSLSLDSLIN